MTAEQYAQKLRSRMFVSLAWLGGAVAAIALVYIVSVISYAGDGSLMMAAGSLFELMRLAGVIALLIFIPVSVHSVWRFASFKLFNAPKTVPAQGLESLATTIRRFVRIDFLLLLMLSNYTLFLAIQDLNAGSGILAGLFGLPIGFIASAVLIILAIRDRVKREPILLTPTWNVINIISIAMIILYAILVAVAIS